MFVILEGVDGSGKTTLAEAVAKELQNRYPDAQHELFHRGPPERHPLDEYAFDIEDYRPGAGVHVVADRWHYGELIYGPIYRGKSELGTSGFRWLELFLKARGVAVWHVTQSLDTLHQRL